MVANAPWNSWPIFAKPKVPSIELLAIVSGQPMHDLKINPC